MLTNFFRRESPVAGAVESKTPCRDGLPHGLAVALGIVAAFSLAFFAIVVFGGFP